MGRIILSDTIVDATIKMADGNPGAVTVMAELLKMQDGFIALAHLDDAGIYGPNIWLAYKDVCGSDINELHNKLFDHKIKAELEAYKAKLRG